MDGNYRNGYLPHGTHEYEPQTDTEAVAQAWARAQQQVDAMGPQTVAPASSKVPTDVDDTEPSWWRRLLGAKTQRERDLETQVAALEARLAIERLENQLLAELNENYRRWTLAQTAAAANIMNVLGAPTTLPGGK